MLRIRICEESFIDPILTKEIHCPVHLYSGEEAIATGISAALKKTDYIFGGHRSHGHYLAKGGNMNELVAEVFCKEGGCSHGRGGSMHLIDPDNGLLGSAPIVAGTIALAVGAALASRIRKDKRVVVSYFGDGATGEGVLYESLNFAALKNLPIIFACENNLYSTHLPIHEIRVDKKISDVAKPFGIVSYTIDGNDVLAIYELAKKSVDLCRRSKGPVFIEFLTYRQRGHVGPDDNIQGSHTDIRPKKEIEKWLKKDPLKRFERYLIRNRVLTVPETKLIKAEIENEVQQAHQFARQSPYPKPEELNHYVYAK